MTFDAWAALDDEAPEQGSTSPTAPSACSYCGGAEFDAPTDNGKVSRATCTACQGTMVSHDGVYWQPDLIGQPDNHPSTQADPRSGGVGGIGDVPVVRREEDLNSRTAGFENRITFRQYLPGEDEHADLDSHDPGWAHGLLEAHGNAAEPIGRMEFSAGPDTVKIHETRVHQDHRRQGVATALNDRLTQLFPHHEIDRGAATEDGEKFRQSLAGVDWCRHRRGEHCWLPRNDSQSGGFALYTPQDRGVCPWTTASMQQINCPMSEPGPMAGMERAGVLTDPEMRFHVLAAWRDVRAKAKRIRAEGGVSIVSVLADGITGHVNGDTGVYESQINYVPGSFKIGHWQCGCAWASYAWGRSPAFKRFEGRMCSHALALQYEAQSRGMFGKEVAEDTTRPGWMRDKVRVRHDRVTRDHDVRAASLQSGLDPDGVYPTGHGLDLEGAPIHAFASEAFAARRDPADAMRVFLAAGIEHTDARRMLDAIAVGDQSLHMEVQRTFDKVHDDYRERHQDDHELAETYEPLKKSDLPEEHHAGWRFNSNADAAPKNQFHELFSTMPGGWDGPTHDTDAHHAPVALTKYRHPSGIEPLHLDEHGQAWARHFTSRPRQDGAHSPVFDHWSGPHSAMDVIHSHPTFSQRDGKVNWRSHAERMQLSSTLPEESYQDVHQRKMRKLRDAGWGVVGAKGDDEAPSEPTHAGVVLKAADTGRILMIQRSHQDETDPAAGTWEFPGGGREDGDHTSLHSGIREFEEEVGQEFPTGGHVSHVWQSPNGVYQGHVVVVPSESAIDFSNGRRTTNPDDPDGDDHEQSAWWDPDHARKNPALRPECKASPWDKIKTASLGTEAGIFTRKPVGPDTRPPVDPADEKPMRACDGCKGCAVCGDKSVAVDTLWDHGFCPQHLHERQSGQDPIRDGGRLKPVLAGAHHVGRRHVTGEYASGDYLEDIGVDPRPNPPPKRPEPDQAANPGSTGWASGQDPPEWDGAAQNPGTMSLTSWSTLHDEPEPALPSTDGAEETEGERYRAQMRPEIDPTEDSAPSDGRTASVTDIVERFQATAGARALQQQRGSEAMDIASAARAHLEDGGIRRTALKEFSSAEQAALITEGAGGTPARNFDDLKIEGTHYADLAAALASEQSLTEAADELFS